MSTILQQSLAILGCKDKQIRLYLATLEVGSATLPELAKKAKIKRSTAYVLVHEMIDMKLLVDDRKTYNNRYSCVPIETVLAMVEAKKRQFGRNSLALKEAIPEIKALYGVGESHIPKVRTFEGNSGLIAIWADILKSQTEILLWSNQESEELFFTGSAHFSFIEERMKKHIHLRALLADNQKGIELQKNDALSFRQTKLLPKSVHFTSEVYVYDNKVATIDFNKTIFGVITESKQIADFHRANFEHVWSNL